MIEGWLGAANTWPLVMLVALAFVMALGETAFFTDFLVPGEVAMVFFGAAAADRDSVAVSVSAIAVAGGLGAIVGEMIGFSVGRAGAHRLDRSSGRWAERGTRSRERARRLLDRFGGVAVVVARLVGPLRAVVPVIAGASGWTRRRLLRWSIVASIVWPAYVVVLGAVAGRRVAEWIDRAGLVVLPVALGVMVFVFFRASRARS